MYFTLVPLIYTFNYAGFRSINLIALKKAIVLPLKILSRNLCQIYEACPAYLILYSLRDFLQLNFQSERRESNPHI